MIEDLKFVQGAIAKKDFAPELTHFRITEGKVIGFNGRLCLCSPIELDLDVTPKALTFVKAIETCKDTVVMKLTEAGRLSIKSGKFKAFIECLEKEAFPSVEPEGEYMELQGGFVKELAQLAPFIAEDASRPWATGILIKDQSMFATNNVLLVQKWLGTPFPCTVNLPVTAIKEILRIKQEPIGIQMSSNTLTLHYENGRWLRTNLLDTEWPDLGSILDKPSDPKEFPEEFFEILESLKPFGDELERVYFNLDSLSTTPDGGEGASYDIEGLPVGGVYQIKQLLKLQGMATTIDFDTSPALFFGDAVRGAVLGMRK